MAIRKNLRFKGASARPARHHADKHAARYIRTLQKPWGPLVVSGEHGRGTAEDGANSLHSRRYGTGKSPRVGRGSRWGVLCVKYGSCDEAATLPT